MQKIVYGKNLGNLFHPCGRVVRRSRRRRCCPRQHGATVVMVIQTVLERSFWWCTIYIPLTYWTQTKSRRRDALIHFDFIFHWHSRLFCSIQLLGSSRDGSGSSSGSGSGWSFILLLLVLKIEKSFFYLIK